MTDRVPTPLVLPLALAAILSACEGATPLLGPSVPPLAPLGAAGFPLGLLATFDAGELPEGIAVSKAGDLYVGISTTGVIYRLRPGQPGSGDIERSVVATPGAGLLGLAVDARGNIYAAVASFDPATHGVWRIDADGAADRLAGSAAIFFPNALAFDDRGSLYVTSSSGPPAGVDTWVDGQIWRVPPGGPAELWLQHPLLTGTGSPLTAPPFPLGANGIAYRAGELFVANTEKGLLAVVPIEGGNPGMPTVLADGFSFLDGLALDVHGNIYLLEIGLTRLIRVSADGDHVESLAGPFDGVHFATSLAFGTGRGDRQSVFLANAAFPQLPHPAPVGPSVLKVEVDTPGLPLP